MTKRRVPLICRGGMSWKRGMAPLVEPLSFELFAAPDFLGFLPAGVLSSAFGFSDESVISNETGIVLFLFRRCKRIAGLGGGVQASMIFLRMA